MVQNWCWVRLLVLEHKSGLWHHAVFLYSLQDSETLNAIYLPKDVLDGLERWISG